MGGILFFVFTLSLFFLKEYLPKPQLKSSSIISPEVENNKVENFRKELKKKGINYESITLATTSSTMIVKLGKDSYAYVNTLKDPIAQIKILSEILVRLGIENPDKKIKYIDLRFEKAVVKYK